jgi:hypothetical protein
MSDIDLQPVLAIVLDTLIPPRQDIPGAGSLGLTQAVLLDAEETGRTDDLGLILSQIPAGFYGLATVEREGILRALEQQEPEAFWAVIDMAYTAYYTHAAVLAGISERTGYNPGPPQPLGYVLEPFDDVLLDPVRRMSPLWRPDS